MLYRMQRQEIIVLKEGNKQRNSTFTSHNIHVIIYDVYMSMNTICKINLNVKEEKEVLRRNF